MSAAQEEANEAVVRRGTNRGPLGDLEPTGARVEYSGAAFFRIADGLIEEAWVVGDTQRLWRALGPDSVEERQVI